MRSGAPAIGKTARFEASFAQMRALSLAMPGRGALLAAVQPANAQALYFVARGDGSSQFSNTLDEHNRAVNKYQRGP